MGVKELRDATQVEMDKVKAELLERRQNRDGQEEAIRRLVAEEETLAQVLGVYDRRAKRNGDAA